jgi:hypothetical protein
MYCGRWIVLHKASFKLSWKLSAKAATLEVPSNTKGSKNFKFISTRVKDVDATK